jgi:hypothetical protein
MSQKDEVLGVIKRRWITPMLAFEMGITCLAERIRDLREDGYAIEDVWREQNGKRFKAYRLTA